MIHTGFALSMIILAFYLGFMLGRGGIEEDDNEDEY